MALQIRRPPTAFSQQPTGKISKRVEDKNYLDFIRQLPCIVTGTYGVEAAHISFPMAKYGKLGRGKGSKENDAWTVPLSPEEHRRQHSMAETAYWDSVGIDPCIVAMSLYMAYPNIELAELVIRNIERKGITFGKRGELWPAGRGDDYE